jgi:hypothetical protein
VGTFLVFGSQRFCLQRRPTLLLLSGQEAELSGPLEQPGSTLLP